MKRFLAAAVLFAVICAAASASGLEAPGTQERFYVTGFVKSPGSYEHRPAMTVQQGIATAGGLTERGSTRGVRIARQVDGQNVYLDAQLSDLVQPNDTIVVRQRLQ